MILAKAVLRKRRIPKLFHLPFQCNSIRIKHNLRIFGFGPSKDLSVKIAVNSALRVGSLYREIKARKLLNNKQLSFIPSIVEYDPKGKWVVDELITASNNISYADKAGEFINKHALSFYQATARAKPLRRSFNLEAIKETPEIFANKVDLDHKWPVALCHGDLSPGNMLLDNNNQLYLVDWELAGVRPVAFDVLNIFIKYPEYRNNILAMLNDLSSEKELDSNLQIGLALANYIYDIKQNMERNINYLIGRGMEKDRAIERIDQEIALMHKLTNDLI